MHAARLFQPARKRSCEVYVSSYGLFRFSSTRQAHVSTNKRRKKSVSKGGVVNDQDVTEIGSEHREKVPQTAGWVSLLRSKSLGQSTKILVLRNSEGNPTRRRGLRTEPEVIEQSVKDIDPQVLLKALNSAKEVPGHEEVNRAIEEHRPVNTDQQVKQNSILTRKEFEKKFNDLASSFQNTQIQRYVAIQMSDSFLSNKDGKSNNFSREMRISEWIPSRERYEDIAPLKNRKIGRRRAAYLDILLRNVWNIDILEEIQAEGSLQIDLTRPKFSIVTTGGHNSSIANIGRKQNVKVEIFRNRGSIRITGNKFASNSAVNELRTAVEDSWTDSISLAPICHQNENSLSQERSEQVQSLARQLKCVVKLSKSSAKCQVYAPDRHTFDRFMRLLASKMIALPPLCVTTEVCASNHEYGFLLPTTHQHFKAFAPTSSTKSSTGRFTMVARSVDSAIHESSSESLRRMQTHRSSILKGLDPGAVSYSFVSLDTPSSNRPVDGVTTVQSSSLFNATRSVHAKYIAEFGQVFFAKHGDHLPEDLFSVDDLVKTANPASFSNAKNGVNRFLAESQRLCQPVLTEIVRLDLFLDPWSRESRIQNRAWPTINITLEQSANAATEPEVSGSITPATVFACFPQSSIDLRLMRKDVFQIDKTSNEAELEPFIDSVRSFSGDKKSWQPPPTLSLRVPFWITSRDSDSALQTIRQNSEAKKLRFFTRDIEHVQELRFAHDGHDLIYRRIRSDTFHETHESLSLELDSNAKLQSQTHALAVGLSKDSFLDTAFDILHRLALGTGKVVNTSMVGSLLASRNSDADGSASAIADKPSINGGTIGRNPSPALRI